MEAKHTPGPWKIREDNLGCKEIFGPPRPGGLDYETDIATTNGIYLEGEDLANARLIAAAPELLEALQAFVDYHEGDFPYEEEDGVDGRMPEMAKAIAAIGKAKGE